MSKLSNPTCDSMGPGPWPWFSSPLLGCPLETESYCDSSGKSERMSNASRFTLSAKAAWDWAWCEA